MLGQSGAEWTFLLSKGTLERSRDVFLGGLIGSREALYDSMSMVATSRNLVVLHWLADSCGNRRAENEQHVLCDA